MHRISPFSRPLHTLSLSLMLAATLVVGCSLSSELPASKGMIAAPVSDSQKLLFPPQEPANNASLTAQVVTVRLGGQQIQGLGYHNGLLGPTLIAHSGDQVKIRLQNQLSESTNLHWHGLIVPADQDGYPDQFVAPGASREYTFPIQQTAGLYWYHPHPDGKTARQAYLGLAGLFVVRDQAETQIKLPDADQEVFLVLQDKRLSAAGLDYRPTQQDVMSGLLGNDILVNGQLNPKLEVAPGLYRLRLLNGSNARVYNLGFDQKTPFWVIGGDGGLLDKPVTTESLLLGPAERVDLLVDFSHYKAGDRLKLNSLPFNAGQAQGSQSFKLLDISITQAQAKPFAVPETLGNLTRLQPTQSVKTRNFEIKGMPMTMVGNGQMMSGSGSMPGMMMPGMDQNQPMNQGMNMGQSGSMGMHTINGRVFDSQRIDETVAAGSTETWIFDNSQGDEIHPMHVHGVRFQLLKREGGRAQIFAHESGWKDTVLLLPKEKVSVMVQFPDYKGKYLIHCHNLEHEDDGMMLNFEIK